MTTDEKYMRAALKQAEKAYNLGETPIGCVIVHEDKIIARGYNRRNTDKNPLAHAEVAAIKKASKKLGDWRLEECTLYVTLEPCQMCAGAIVQSRIPRVVVGCMNPKAGCTGSILNLLNIQAFNHQADLTTGVLEEECSQLMKQFFRELREARKMKKKAESDQNRIELRSEKVRNMIGEMPSFLIRWGNTILVVIFVLLALIAWFAFFKK